MVASGSSVIVSITGNIGPSTFASDYFVFLSTHNLAQLNGIHNASDYIITGQVYYKAQTNISKFTFNLQSLLPPSMLVLQSLVSDPDFMFRIVNDNVPSTQIYAKLILATMEEHVCTLATPLQHVHVHQASMEQAAPMTSNTVLKPPV